MSKQFTVNLSPERVLRIEVITAAMKTVNFVVHPIIVSFSIQRKHSPYAQQAMSVANDLKYVGMLLLSVRDILVIVKSMIS